MIVLQEKLFSSNKTKDKYEKLKVKGEITMKVCLVFFSKTGNTRTVAQLLKKQFKEKKIDIDEIEIEPVKMPGFMMSGYAGGRQKELPIKNTDIDLCKYDFVIFGAPIWNGKPAPFLKTSINKAENISGKYGSFFITHAAPIGKNIEAPIVFKENMENRGINVIDSYLSLQTKKDSIEDGKQKIDDFINTVQSIFKK